MDALPAYRVLLISLLVREEQDCVFTTEYKLLMMLLFLKNNVLMYCDILVHVNKLLLEYMHMCIGISIVVYSEVHVHF